MSRFGTFTYVATKEACDFNVQQGYPRELAEKMVGVKTTMKAVDMGESKMFVHFVVDGHPELSSCFVCQEGIENNVNIPLFGGKVVFTFNSTNKGYHSVVESEGMGKWEMDEEYTAEGITSFVTKGGKSYTDHWKREVNINGLYKYKSNKDMKEYLRSLQWPESMVNTTEYDFFVEVCETGMKAWERIGGVEVTFDGKFGIETGWQLPFPGVPEAKLTINKIGFAKYQWQMTYGGTGEEWTMDCSGPEDMMLYGRNLNSDVKCSIEMYKETLPIMGKWKQVSESGVLEGYKMLGVPAGQAKEIADEIIELDIDEKGPLIHWNWKSKFTPTDISFKWQEEIDHYDPILKANTKNIATKCDNAMEIITKSENGTWITKATAGVTFMTMTSYQQGLEKHPLTYTFMRKEYI